MSGPGSKIVIHIQGMEELTNITKCCFLRNDVRPGPGHMYFIYRVVHNTGHPKVWLSTDSNMIPLISLSVRTVPYLEKSGVSRLDTPETFVKELLF